jgi:hypothetical protein
LINFHEEAVEPIVTYYWHSCRHSPVKDSSTYVACGPQPILEVEYNDIMWRLHRRHHSRSHFDHDETQHALYFPGRRTCVLSSPKYRIDPQDSVVRDKRWILEAHQKPRDQTLPYPPFSRNFCMCLTVTTVSRPDDEEFQVQLQDPPRAIHR